MRRRIDYPLLAIAFTLLLVGLLIISSASTVIAEENFGWPYAYLVRQGIAALVGLGALACCAAVPYKLWRRFSLPILIVALVLVAAVFLPSLGFTHGGATRWLRIGPTTIQPSEILKFSLILYLSSWLDRRKAQPKRFATAFVPFLVIVSIAGALLILQPDIGTLIIVTVSATLLYLLGGGRTSQLVTFALLATVALAILIQVAPYRLNRLLVFFNPELDPQGIGYHITQARIAIGSGGFWGRGFGQSIQKHNFLPEPIGDSIFAVVAEEFGFLGSVGLASLFFAFFLRAMAIVRRTQDFFGKLLVAGTASLIVFQAYLNIASISGFAPLTGVPLPFISYGGTSLVVTLAMVGIMLNISKHAR